MASQSPAAPAVEYVDPCPGMKGDDEITSDGTLTVTLPPVSWSALSLA